MEIQGYNLPEDLYYEKNHNWVKVEGDILVIHDTGAHGHAMGFNYNGKLRSAELLLKADGTVVALGNNAWSVSMTSSVEFRPVPIIGYACDVTFGSLPRVVVILI